MKVILPGSYDPVTLGHLDIIRRAAEIYDEVYAVVFVNPEKQYRFTPDQRVAMLMLATDHLPNVLVSYSTGLVIDYMRDHGIERIVKGYRNDADLRYEEKMAEWNLKMGGYETELWQADPRLVDVSSTAVRREMDLGMIPSHILPPPVSEYIEELRKNGQI